MLFLVFSLGLLFRGSCSSLSLGFCQSLLLSFGCKLLLPHHFVLFGLSFLLCSKNSCSLFGGSSSLSSQLTLTLLFSSFLLGSSTSSCLGSALLSSLVLSVSIPEHESTFGGSHKSCCSLAGSSSYPCSDRSRMSSLSSLSSGSLSSLALCHCSSMCKHFISTKDEHPPMGGAFPKNGLSSDMGSSLSSCCSHSLQVGSSSLGSKMPLSSKPLGADTSSSGTLLSQYMEPPKSGLVYPCTSALTLARRALTSFCSGIGLG